MESYLQPLAMYGPYLLFGLYFLLRFVRTNFLQKKVSNPSEAPPDAATAAVELPQGKIQSPMQQIYARIKSDPGYAWSWHSALVSSATDKGIDAQQADEIAYRFMQKVFNMLPKTETAAQVSAGVDAVHSVIAAATPPTEPVSRAFTLPVAAPTTTPSRSDTITDELWRALYKWPNEKP